MSGSHPSSPIVLESDSVESEHSPLSTSLILSAVRVHIPVISKPYSTTMELSRFPTVCISRIEEPAGPIYEVSPTC